MGYFLNETQFLKKNTGTIPVIVQKCSYFNTISEKLDSKVKIAVFEEIMLILT